MKAMNSMSGKTYGREVREIIIKLHLDNKRTIASLSKEYGISSSTISRWLTVNKNRSSVARRRSVAD